MDSEPSKKRKRGPRGPKPGKNFRDGLRRLADASQTAGQAANATSTPTVAATQVAATATVPQQTGTSVSHSEPAVSSNGPLDDQCYIDQVVDASNPVEEPALSRNDQLYLSQVADGSQPVTELAVVTPVDVNGQVANGSNSETEAVPERNDQLYLSQVANGSQPVPESAAPTIEVNIEMEAEVVTSIEGSDDAHYLEQLRNASDPVISDSEFAVPELNEANGDSDREVSWSPSPTPPPPQLAQLSTVQPYGDYVVVLCRLSSEKYEEGWPRTQRRQAVAAHFARRVREGVELARRLAINCPRPYQFTTIQSHCRNRHSWEDTNWQKRDSASSMYVREVRDMFKAVENQKVTILVRAIDGITTNIDSLEGFCEFVVSCGITAQLIFQFNKVCDEIRPKVLRPCKGLGSTTDIMLADLLDHLKEGSDQGSLRYNADAARIVEVLKYVQKHKSNQQGIQDRNTLPRADLEKAVEVMSITNSAGRRLDGN
jgi:hypothetical protein